MDPNKDGIHPDLFGPGLLGLCFLTIVEAGFIFSGNVGTGILLARKPDGSWSPPSAIGISSLGMGIIIGASLKHIVYLIYDSKTIKTMAGDVGVKFGAQLEASIGNWGRTADITNYISNKGLGQNIALSYSSGLFGGISLEGGVCNPRTNVNEKFYGKKVKPEDILFQDGAVQIPDGTLLPEIYAKLDKLSTGIGLWDPSDAEKVKCEMVREEADKEGEEQLKEEQIEYVDVSSEIKE